jgi:hypothetical protein
VPYFLKISFGILELALLIFYLGFSGRSSRRAPVTSSSTSNQ